MKLLRKDARNDASDRRTRPLVISSQIVTDAKIITGAAGLFAGFSLIRYSFLVELKDLTGVRSEAPSSTKPPSISPNLQATDKTLATPSGLQTFDLLEIQRVFLIQGHAYAGAQPQSSSSASQFAAPPLTLPPHLPTFDLACLDYAASGYLHDTFKRLPL